MLHNEGCNFAEHFTRQQFNQLRETMVSMILATDMKVPTHNWFTYQIMISLTQTASSRHGG